MSEQKSDSMFADVIARGSRLLRVLFSAHFEVAQQEAAADFSRMLSGVAFLAFALFWALLGLMLLDLSLVFGLAAGTSLLWWQAFAGVALGNVGLALFFALLGRRKLKGPLLHKTRGLVNKTYRALVD